MTSCTVKGVAEGTAHLEIKSLDGNTTKYVDITVSPVILTSFNLPATLSLKTAGTEKSKTLTADQFTGSDGNAMNGITVAWSKVPENADFTITPNGNMVIVTAGTTASANTYKVVATVGNLSPKECAITVAQLTGDAPDGTYKPSMSGDICIDVRDGQPEPGSKSYTITEDGSKIISAVDWEVIESSTGNLLISQHATGTNNVTETLAFKDRASLSTTVTPNPQTVTVNAYITYTDQKVVKLSQVVKIQSKPCCEGTIVYSGNLCWYKTDAGLSTWYVQKACASGFRWPTISELEDLYTALGHTRMFSNISTRGEIAESTTDLQESGYWSISKYNGTWYSVFDFRNSWGVTGDLPTAEWYVRCVRNL
jgi:hypothetical protein